MIFLENLWDIMRELAAWLLLGAFIAAVLHVLIPKDFVKKHLGGSTWWATIKASFIGVPMPLCSCSVIPTGIGLKKDGASDGASVSFLISTPQTGVDSISVAAGFLGWPFAIFKVISAFIMGVIGGQLVNMFANEALKQQADAPKSCCDKEPEPVTSCCGPQPEPEPVKSCCGPQEEVEAPKSCCGTETTVENTITKKESVFFKGAHFAIEELLRMIWLWLVVGVLLSALLSSFIDPGSLQDYAWASGITAMFLMLIISLPLYVCATASVPIAASLIAAGLPTGAALVFLMAGPATNIATVGAIIKAFGKKITVIYLAVVIIGSIGFGVAFDYCFAMSYHSEHIHLHEHSAWWMDACAILLTLLLVYFAITDLKKYLYKKSVKGETTPTEQASCH